MDTVTDLLFSILDEVFDGVETALFVFYRSVVESWKKHMLTWRILFPFRAASAFSYDCAFAAEVLFQSLPGIGQAAIVKSASKAILEALPREYKTSVVRRDVAVAEALEAIVRPTADLLSGKGSLTLAVLNRVKSTDKKIRALASGNLIKILKAWMSGWVVRMAKFAMLAVQTAVFFTAILFLISFAQWLSKGGPKALQQATPRTKVRTENGDVINRRMIGGVNP